MGTSFTNRIEQLNPVFPKGIRSWELSGPGLFRVLELPGSWFVSDPGSSRVLGGPGSSVVLVRFGSSLFLGGLVGLGSLVVPGKSGD